MSTYKELTERDIETVNWWFEKHKATVQETQFGPDNPVTKIIWGQPGTGNCQIVYLIYGRYLTVLGDLGEAVYEWSQTLTHEFLAHLDLGYFGGKCQASSEEPRGKTWDADRARLFIEDQLKEWAEENPLDCPTCSDIHYNQPDDPELPDELKVCPTCKDKETVPRPPLTLARCAELLWEEDDVSLDEIVAHAHAWGRWMYEGDGLILSDQKQKVDAYGERWSKKSEDYPRRHFEESYDAGYKWDLRTRAHLTGLKMAWEQLHPKAEAAA